MVIHHREYTLVITDGSEEETMEKLKTVAEIVSAFGTLIVGATVAYIAYRQHKTDRNKVRCDLYERRLQLFQTVMTSIAHLVQKGEADEAVLREFNRAGNESTFLFNRSVAQYLETMYSKAVDLQATNTILADRNITDGEERSQTARKHGELVKWFSHQFKGLKDRLRPQMGFEE